MNIVKEKIKAQNSQEYIIEVGFKYLDAPNNNYTKEYLYEVGLEYLYLEEVKKEEQQNRNKPQNVTVFEGGTNYNSFQYKIGIILSIGFSLCIILWVIIQIILNPV